MESWADIRKNGGSYNQRAFIDMKSGAVRAMSDPYRSFRRILRSVGTDAPIARFATGLIEAGYQDAFDKTSSIVHANVSEVMENYPDEWKSYFKFAFVRNPFDFAVSDYLNKEPATIRENVSFTEYLKRMADPARPDPERIVPNPRNNLEIYTHEAQIAVDFLGRFENLLSDVQKICELLDIPFISGEYPHAQKTGVSDSWRKLYKIGDREIAAEAFKDEVELAGYEW